MLVSQNSTDVCFILFLLNQWL